MAICKDPKPLYGCKTPAMRGNFLPDPNAIPPGATHHDDKKCPAADDIVGDFTVVKPKATTKNKVVIDAVSHRLEVGIDADQFRADAGFFWQTKKEKPIGLASNGSSLIQQHSLEYKSAKGSKIQVSFIDDTDTVSGETLLFGERQATISISPKEPGLWSPGEWASYIDKRVFKDPGEVHFDHAFEIGIPFNEVDLKRFNTAQVPARQKISSNFEYNYYHRLYEELLLSENSPPHAMLPSLYVFESEKHNRANMPTSYDLSHLPWSSLSLQKKFQFAQTQYPNDLPTEAAQRLTIPAQAKQLEAQYNIKYPDAKQRFAFSYDFFRWHITAGGLWVDEFLALHNVGKASKFPADPIYTDFSQKTFEYFTSWVQTYDMIKDFVSAGKMNWLISKFRNTIITINDLITLLPGATPTTNSSDERWISQDGQGYLAGQGFNSKKEIYPMFAEIRFPTDSDTRVEQTNNPRNLDFLTALKNFGLDAPMMFMIMESIEKDSALKNLQKDIDDKKRQFELTGGGTTAMSREEMETGQRAGEGMLAGGGFETAMGQLKPTRAPESFALPKSSALLFYENNKVAAGSGPPAFSQVAKSGRRVWNMLAIMEEYRKLLQNKDEYLTNPNLLKNFDGRDSDVAVFLGTRPVNVRNFSSKEWYYWKKFQMIFADAAITSTLKTNNYDTSGKNTGGLLRKFKEVMEGNLAHSETMFYRIEKSLVGGTGETIQNFFIPNDPAFDITEWVDTQVKYGETYIYQIWAYQLVFGTAYNYKSATHWPDGKATAVTVQYKPSVSIVEVPYSNVIGRMTDSPPVDPDVDMVSFVNVNDKIMISLSSNTGDFFREPIIIEQKELEYYNNLPSSIKKSRTFTNKEGKSVTVEEVRFKSDDPVEKYIVYRIEKRPKSYLDFAGSGKEVKSSFGATSVNFIDKIVPNKKYYYTFKSIDNHGHISYPSSIYEAEMVDDAGSIFLNVRVIELEEDPFKHYSKPMKKYISISPAFAQVEMDIQNSPSNIANMLNRVNASAKKLSSVVLGSQKQSVFGKKFKIRITSKSSGRKIDINLRYEKEHKVPTTTTT